MLSPARENRPKRICRLTLDRLDNEVSGLIVGIQAEGHIRRRLLDLGFVPGTKVKAVRRSPIGDPIAFKIRGTLIALRKEVARQVLVSL